MFIFRTSDMSKWGVGKETNLTPTEVDENFWDAEERISALEDNPVVPMEIQSINVTGNKMTITLEDGVTIFGPFTLPEAAFNFRNEYTPGEDYALYDFFTADDGLYMALQTVEDAASEFDPDEANLSGPFWKLIMPFPNLYDIGFFFPGTPGNGIVSGKAMFTYRANRSFYLLEDLTGISAGLQVATTVALSFPIYKNTTLIGSFDIAAAATSVTVTFAASVQFNTGDRLRVLRPTALDVTAEDFSVTFPARKGTL